MSYTNRDYAEMHFIYGKCRGNAEEAADEYRRQFPDQILNPTPENFKAVHKAYSEGRNPNLNDSDDDYDDENYGPYSMEGIPILRPGDEEKRLKYCKEMLKRHEKDPHFLEKILWTDEATVCADCVLNFHDIYSYEFGNPAKLPKIPFENQLWTGILAGQVIGPHKIISDFESIQVIFLEIELPALLQNVPLNTRKGMWIQISGPVDKHVKDCLDKLYPNKWIGSGGTIEFPPRSPDLNLFFYYYWYLIKDVFHKDFDNADELLELIKEKAVTVNDKKSMNSSYLRRLKKCVKAEGGTFKYMFDD